jgi:hypothetical protein
MEKVAQAAALLQRKARRVWVIEVGLVFMA